MKVPSSQVSQFPYVFRIVSSLLSLSLGFGRGWMSGDIRWAGTLEVVSIIGFVLLTATASWQFRGHSPTMVGVAFGGILAATTMFGWVCGGNAATYAATGQLNPASMIVLGLAIYSLVGLSFGAVGGWFIGGMLSMLIRLRLVDGNGKTNSQAEPTEFGELKSEEPSDKSTTNQISNASTEDKFVRIVGLLAIGLYGLSLVLPAIGTSGGYNQAQLGLAKQNPGLWVLILSMATCLMLNPMWLANPLAWCGAVLLTKKKYRWAAVAASLSAVLSISGVFMFKTVTKGGDQYELLIGCYVWMTSTVILAAGSTAAAMLFQSKSPMVHHEQ